MKRLWNSKIFWFIIICIVLYFYFAPVLELLIHRQAMRGPLVWSPNMFAITFIISSFPFISLRFFPKSGLTKIIIKTKKVFKIVILAAVPLLFLSYSFWYSPTMVNSESESYKAACSYIRQDTCITNKIGAITDLKESGTKYSFSSEEKTAEHGILVVGLKGNLSAEIVLTNKDHWTVDTAIYTME